MVDAWVHWPEITHKLVELPQLDNQTAKERRKTCLVATLLKDITEKTLEQTQIRSSTTSLNALGIAGW